MTLFLNMIENSPNDVPGSDKENISNLESLIPKYMERLVELNAEYSQAVGSTSPFRGLDRKKTAVRGQITEINDMINQWERATGRTWEGERPVQI